MKITKFFGMAVLVVGLAVAGTAVLVNGLAADGKDAVSDKATPVAAKVEPAEKSVIADVKPVGEPVGITADLMSIKVKTPSGKEVEIKRNQDNTATINPDFTKTSRPCPPFCVQPDVLADGVETIAENGMLSYLEKMTAGDDSILVIDSRTPGWVKKGTIPGAKNLPWTSLSPRKGATTDSIIKIMSEEFGVTLAEGVDTMDVDEAVVEGDTSEVFDFSKAKTLVMFCNGMWCGQSPTNILQLLKMGYPAEKIKWYRGGMQNWSVLGFNTVKGGE